jgi:hypothetical protein
MLIFNPQNGEMYRSNVLRLWKEVKGSDNGFDEWFGIPNSSDESLWPDNDMLRLEEHPGLEYEHVMESLKGEVPRKLRLYDLEARTRIDREITDRAIDFMGRKAGRSVPFFAYVPYTQTHYPVLPHPDFRRKTGNGRWADTLAQIDARTHVYLGALLPVENVYQEAFADGFRRLGLGKVIGVRTWGGEVWL